MLHHWERAQPPPQLVASPDGLPASAAGLKQLGQRYGTAEGAGFGTAAPCLELSAGSQRDAGVLGGREGGRKGHGSLP